MTDLEYRQLVNQAIAPGQDQPPPAFDARSAIIAGRRALRRRRAIGTAAAGLLAVTVAATGAVLWPPTPVRTSNLANPPVVTPAPAPSIGPEPPPGLSLLRNGTVVEAGGTQIPLGLSAGYVISDPSQTPDGYLFAAYRSNDPTDQNLWFKAAGNAPVEVGRMAGGYEVSADGRTLVVAGTDGANEVTAYRFPTLQEIGHTVPAFPANIGSDVIGVDGDFAVLAAANGGLGSVPIVVWNFQTGATSHGDTGVAAWSVANKVLLQTVFKPDSQQSGTDKLEPTCLDAVPLGNPLPAKVSGYCGPLVNQLFNGQLSPNGNWVLFHDRILLVSDLLIGRITGTPLTVDGDGTVAFWRTDATAIVSRREGEVFRYYQCGLDGRCVDLDAGGPGLTGDASYIPLVGPRA